VQEVLGHNSKVVNQAYLKQAEVTVPSLDDWEKKWEKVRQRPVSSELLPVSFQSTLMVISQTN
jgi:Zn/Cd-binding protein ZinT